MKTDAQYNLFDEIIKPKIFLVFNVAKGGVRVDINPYTGQEIVVKKEEEYIEYGGYTIDGFTFFEDFPHGKAYFTYFTKLIDSFVKEVYSNKYDKTIDYITYLEDLITDLEGELKNSFDDFHGLTRYVYFTEIIHFDFNGGGYHYKIEKIPDEHILHRIINHFSRIMQTTLNDVLEKLNNIYSGKSEPIDARINCDAGKGVIESYFYQLLEKDDNDNQFLKKEDIDWLLQANFQGFDKTTEKRKLKTTLSGVDIYYFIYKFIDNFHPTGDRMAYAKLCQSFIKLKNTEIENIIKNFRKEKPKRYPRSIE